MKSIRSCNDLDHEDEDDIELLSPSSTSNNGKLKQTTIQYNTVDCDETTNASSFNDSSALSIKEEEDDIVSFQSKCHIDDIPEDARGWTWSDPFHDTNDPSNHDIIAAFDIDRTIYDRWTICLCKWWFVVPVMIAALIPVLKMYGVQTDLIAILLVGYGFMLLPLYVLIVCWRSEWMLRIKRFHIAIGTRGIYIDEIERTCPLVLVVHPWSKNEMRRTIVAYDEIKKCQVQSTYSIGGPVNLYYTITVSTKDDYPVWNEGDLKGYSPRHTFGGIENQQMFVDIVNAMMERRSSSTDTSTNTVGVSAFNASSIGTSDGESILYRSKCDIDEIPQEARGITWSDAFYDTDDRRISQDIIAAFDIDHTVHDRSVVKFLKWYFWIPIISLSMMVIFIKIGVPFFVNWGSLFYIGYLIYGPFFLIVYLGVYCTSNEKKALLHWTHIAISTRGIYIDEVDTASSNCLQRRTRVAFNDIQNCQVVSVKDYLRFETRDMIIVCLKDECRYKIVNEKHGEYIGPAIKHTIEGIQNQQQFVDIVNAMMRPCETRRVDDRSGPTYQPEPDGRW